MIAVVSAHPFYQDTLRQLPEKLRQERIHAKVYQEVKQIQTRIIQEASTNQTFLNFTLYCVDPNRQYRESKKILDHNHGRIPQKEELYYSYPIFYRQGFEYQRDGPRYRYSTPEDRHLETELIYPRPYCHAKHGYELYQRTHGKLEDSPQAYATLFFQILNQMFPDIHLAVSNHRPSEGPYDSDCCPLFTVSW